MREMFLRGRRVDKNYFDWGCPRHRSSCELRVCALPSGAATSTPIPSGKTSKTGKVRVNNNAELTPAAVGTAAATSVNVFVPIGTATPAASVFPRRGDNPAPVVGIVNTNKPVNTNKFYANFFLENQYESAVSLSSVQG